MKTPFNTNVSKAGIILASFCLFSNNVMADCDSTAGTHYPTMTGPNYQGSAHTDAFDCSINGSKQMSLNEINEITGLLPPSLNNRFYIRIGANAAAEGLVSPQIYGVNNVATQVTGTLGTTSSKTASNSFQLAVGYVWSEFAFDLEWLNSQTISFSSIIYNVSPTFTLNSVVKGDALLGNIYWFFQDLYNVKLYIDLIVGYSQNNSTNYINSGPVTTFKKDHWAFGGGVGGRFNIWSKLFADINGRYIYLGTARLVATDGSDYTWIKIKRTWLGASVNLLWLF